MAPTQSKEYFWQSRWTLQNAFPGVSVAWIDSVHRSYDYKFADTFNALTAVVNSNGGGKAGEVAHIKIFVKKKRPLREFNVTDAQLLGEIEGIPELNTKLKSDSAGAKVEQAVVDLIDLTLGDSFDAPTQGPESECLCCYVDHPLADLLECSAGSGHLVCRGCINSYVSEQLDGNNCVAFKCIAEADCKHKYSTELLNADGVLSPKLKTRVTDRVFRANVKEAGLGNQWTCPKCAYVGWLDGGNYPWVRCPECDVKYCTGCNDVFHESSTCDEARKAKADRKDPKLRVSEAMSQAAKRFCPHCQQEYMKADGCNKITCKCGKFSCYLCGEKVANYSHFCQHPLDPGTACACGKCKLFTTPQEMEQVDRDRRHAAGRKVLAEAGITDEQKIQSLLPSPTKQKPTASNERAPRNARQLAAAPRQVNVAYPIGQITGNAVHNGNVRVDANGTIGGNATVNGSLMVYRNANVTIGGNATVNGDVCVRGCNSTRQCYNCGQRERRRCYCRGGKCSDQWVCLRPQPWKHQRKCGYRREALCLRQLHH